MKISIISASHRINSQSKKISSFLQNNLFEMDPKIDANILDLADAALPLWSPQKKDGEGIWGETWNSISSNLNESNGFILVVPEYGGMATPAAKNFFLLCGNGELAHKPGLIVSISSGIGGSYPISELRSSSYKNTHLMWIPENIIIRNVEEFNPGAHGENIPDWLDNRIDYVLKLFLTYASNMKPIREIINRKDFGNGM
ncbi:NAD(P)H-dependent oxidoreductase [Alphaproteobacteria bacterium]|nr:NAD(P)H-dependent oxidoreductase [Alphaproteobacteria bacterium]MDC1085850.1 NAD(P)H-dependent oxidoreductase [Alphaproteobacteria bacterium]